MHVLSLALSAENFRERFRNVKDLAELIQMLKHMKEGVGSVYTTCMHACMHMCMCMN